MKATTWAIALLLGFGAILSACTKENGTDPNPDPKPEPSGTAYFSYGFSQLQKNNTRVYSPGEEGGTIEEQQIALIWMLLYDTNGELKYAYELGASNIDKADPTQLAPFHGVDVSTEVSSSEDGFRTVGKEVAVQDYQLVILVNPIYYGIASGYSGYISGFTESKGVAGTGINPADSFYYLSNLIAINQGEGKGAWDYGDTNPHTASFMVAVSAVNSGAGIEYGENGEKITSGTLFFMSNGNGVIQVPASSLQDTQELAEQNPSASVNVDRLFAKIIVNERIGVHTPVLTGGSLESLTWGLSRRSKDIYPIRRMANIFDIAGSNFEGAMETVATDRKNMYAKTLNFDEQDATAFANTDATSFVAWNEWDGVPSSSIVEDNWLYAPENTMPFDVQASDDWAKYTTQVWVKATIHYLFPTPDTNNSYYSWYDAVEDEWVLFSHSMAKAWMASASGSGIDALDLLIGTSKSGAFVKGTSSFFIGATGTNIANFAPPITVSNQTPSLTTDTGKDLTYHHRGYNEYFIPIKHFDTTDGKTEEEKRTGVYGRYGIVRNNVYRVTINSINGPGTPLGDGWISSDIKINGWYTRPGQIEDL